MNLIRQGVFTYAGKSTVFFRAEMDDFERRQNLRMTTEQIKQDIIEENMLQDCVVSVIRLSNGEIRLTVVGREADVEDVSDDDDIDLLG